jgi:choline dehydrogenase-like flavoprotein
MSLHPGDHREPLSISSVEKGEAGRRFSFRVVAILFASTHERRSLLQARSAISTREPAALNGLFDMRLSDSTFDYIIVGAGSAGAVIASRLTEQSDVSVLLLEAGKPDRHPLMAMPLAFRKVYNSPAYGWNYVSEPEPNMLGRQLEIPRGRTLGGTSSINAMIGIRGNRRDFDLLEEQGLDGWGYADVLPYFKRLENSWRGEGPFHGASGPVHVSLMNYDDMVYEPLREAAAVIGIPVNDDPNGVEQDGISRMEATIGSGRRSSTARAYLRPATARPNLTIRIGALTTRILIENGKATGVEYRCNGKQQQVRAEREIVLSAGTYNSPQILMLSGIGPADHLRSAGVRPLHDLPGVGQNLSEHPNLIMLFAASKNIGLTRHLRYDRAARGFVRWFMRHDGIFASNGGAANVFLRTLPGLDRPDVQLTCMSIDNDASLWFPHLTKAPVFGFGVRIGALHPLSRGQVSLRSSKPDDNPRIFFNMFSAPEDLATMIRGVRATRALYAASPMRELIDREVRPGPEIQDDVALAGELRRNGGHRSHPVGTCRMGLDKHAVVDAQLRVNGVEGLRVADASILPEVTSGNTNLPSIMIGEKASDLLLNRALPRDASMAGTT